MAHAKLQVTNLSSGIVLASECLHANSSLSRLVGLLNHSQLREGEGLLLDPCNQIHTFFMRFPIDAVFLSSDDKVVAWAEYKPWRMSKMHFKARKVLEMPLGTCRRHALAIGDRLEIASCSS